MFFFQYNIFYVQRQCCFCSVFFLLDLFFCYIGCVHFVARKDCVFLADFLLSYKSLQYVLFAYLFFIFTVLFFHFLLENKKQLVLRLCQASRSKRGGGCIRHYVCGKEEARKKNNFFFYKSIL